MGVYCIGAGPEFCEQSGIYNGLMTEQHFWDSIWCSYEDSWSWIVMHMNIDLQAGIYGTEIGNEMWKKNFILFKIQSKKTFILPKIAL